MEGKRLHIGYRQFEYAGKQVRGHEFHYSKVLEPKAAGQAAGEAVGQAAGEDSKLAAADAAKLQSMLKKRSLLPVTEQKSEKNLRDITG